MKPDMADDEFDQQFEEIDEDGSGEIEFDEFIRSCRAGRELRRRS